MVWNGGAGATVVTAVVSVGAALTAPRAPGPGPIRKRDWRHIGKKLLRDRHVVSHTDGARAYKLRIPGVMHCNVVHKKNESLSTRRWVPN